MKMRFLIYKLFPIFRYGATAYVRNTKLYNTIRCHVQSPLVHISKGSRLSMLDALGQARSNEFILSRNSEKNISLPGNT